MLDSKPQIQANQHLHKPIFIFINHNPKKTINPNRITAIQPLLSAQSQKDKHRKIN